MRFLKCQFIPVADAYGRCHPHIPALVLHMHHWLTGSSTQWNCSNVPKAGSQSVTRHPTSQVLDCESHQLPTPATDHLSPASVQHRYQSSAADIDDNRSVIRSSSHLVQQAAQLDQCPGSPHSLHWPSVVCSRQMLPQTSSVVSLSCVALGMSTNSSTSFTHCVRWYRGEASSTPLHYNSRNSLDTAESAGNITDDTDFTSDSDTEMTYELPTVRHDASQPRDHVQQITDNQETISELVQRKSASEMTLAELSRTSLNIVPYVMRSVTLQNLVRLGVNLSKIQKVPGVAEYLIKADFVRHIVPQLKFLALVGVEANMVGRIFTVNPLLFLESVEDLELRVGYLVHKKFSLREVACLVVKDPVVLLMDPIVLDEKLAFLQNLFHLTAHQVREVVKKYPKLLPVKNKLLTDIKFHIHEFMGFSSPEIQQLFLQSPEVFFQDKNKLVSRFDYLHNHMLISHQHLLTWPHILATRLFVVKNRHLFLLHQGRAQYDPCKENYVSLQALSATSDDEFSQTVAKSDLQQFYNFCKTL